MNTTISGQNFKAASTKYDKAINRAKNAGVDISSTLYTVAFLESEIDMYRDKIAKLLDEKEKMETSLNNLHCVSQLEAVQESSPGEIIKVLSDNGFNNISINIYKTKEE